MLQHAVFLLLTAPSLIQAQGTLADYRRATNLRKEVESLDISIPGSANWIGATDRFWYRRTVKGGHDFVAVTVSTLAKQPAFDHAKLAESLSKAAGENYTPQSLPFQTFTFSDDLRYIQFTAATSRWRADVASYACEKLGPETGFPRRAGPPRERRQDEAPRVSPDGKREAFIQNFNVYIRGMGAKVAAALSHDGSEANHYLPQSLTWSPDSKKLAAYRIRPGNGGNRVPVAGVHQAALHRLSRHSPAGRRLGPADQVGDAQRRQVGTGVHSRQARG